MVNKEKLGAISCYESLKNLVEEKNNLEKNNKGYINKINNEINDLMKDVSLSDLKTIKICCKQDYDNLINAYKSDINVGVSNYISKKLEINEGCLNVIDRFSELKQNNSRTR